MALLVKEPRPGRAKTRLAKGIGTVAAAAWYRRQLLSLMRRLCFDKRWDAVLAVSPDSAVAAGRFWPKSIPRVPQGTGDLGDRMKRLFSSLPPGPVIIAGSDIPGCSARHVSRAFRLLGRSYAVFGPSPDGGFWMVGLRRTGSVPRRLFRGARWSTEHALEDSLKSLKGKRIRFAEELSDVDSVDDLQLSAASGRGPKARTDAQIADFRLKSR